MLETQTPGKGLEEQNTVSNILHAEVPISATGKNLVLDLTSVLVCFSSYNKIPPTGYLINNRQIFLIVQGYQYGLVRALFWAADFLLWPHMVEGTRELYQTS